LSVGFPKPRTHWDCDPATELRVLRDWAKEPDRKIPAKDASHLLLATWNIANLRVQDRRQKDYRLISEVLHWFDLVAIQETNDDLSGLRAIEEELPNYYRVLFSDPGGNDERYTFLYDSRFIAPLEEVGEVTIPPSDLGKIKLPAVTTGFAGFDRNPYLVSFQARKFQLTLANCHFFGKRSIGFDRRCLEAYAVAWWADGRRRDRNAYVTNVLALGDFNLPKDEPSDRIYAALTAKGLELPKHQTRVPGTNLGGTAQYDQMAVFPGPISNAVTKMGVFDFDTAVFRELWGQRQRSRGQDLRGLRQVLPLRPPAAMGADQDLDRAVEQRWNRARWWVFFLTLALAVGVLIPSLDVARVAIALAGVGLALLVLAVRPADIRDFVQRIQKVSSGKGAVELGASARGAAESTLRDPAKEPEPTEEQWDPIDLRLLMEAKLSYLAKFALSVEPEPTFVTVGNLNYDGKLLTDSEARTAVGLLTLREGDLDDLSAAEARTLTDDANTFVGGMRITVFYRFVKQVLENHFAVSELEHKPRPDFLVWT
jgi:endonuclease/exonuclease/phosphatase family metal-dependent hydrolase